MKARTVLLTLVLCFLAGAVCFASDIQMGTWKLNEAKSKIAAGTPKNSTVVYEAAGDSIKVTIEGNEPDGTATRSEWTGKFDGKDYPSSGNPNEDMRSVKQIDDHTLHVTSKKGGKVVGRPTLWSRPMARVARSQPMEPMHRARNTRALQCTTSSKGSSPRMLPSE